MNNSKVCFMYKAMSKTPSNTMNWWWSIANRCVVETNSAFGSISSDTSDNGEGTNSIGIVLNSINELGHRGCTEIT